MNLSDWHRGQNLHDFESGSGIPRTFIANRLSAQTIVTGQRVPLVSPVFGAQSAGAGSAAFRQ